jgi:hypothetical protein
MVQVIDSISIGEVLAIIASSVLALAAIWAAFQNYKYRPTRIAVLKEHTENLRVIAEEWKGQLPEIPTVTSDIILNYPKPMEVEKRILFRDLVDNHLPTELGLLATWDDLNKSVLTLLDSKRDLIDSIKGEIEKRTGLSEGCYLGNCPGYNIALVRDIMRYRDVKFGRTFGGLTQTEIKGLEVQGSGYIWIRALDERNAQECYDVVNELQKGTIWDEEFQQMYRQWDRCIELEKEMKRKLSDLCHYPYLPGQDCRYLKSP